MLLFHLSFLVVVLIGMVLGDGIRVGGSGSIVGGAGGKSKDASGGGSASTIMIPDLSSQGTAYFLMGSTSCSVDYILSVYTHDQVQPKFTTSNLGCQDTGMVDASQTQVTPYVQKLQATGLYEIGINVQGRNKKGEYTEWAAPRVKFQMQSVPRLFCELRQGFRDLSSEHVASICPEAGTGKGSEVIEGGLELKWIRHRKELTTDLILRVVLNEQKQFQAMVYHAMTYNLEDDREELAIVKYIQPLSSNGLFEIGFNDENYQVYPRINVKVDGSGTLTFCETRQGMKQAAIVPPIQSRSQYQDVCPR